jgi:hypothetical protein
MENPTCKNDAWQSRWAALEQTIDHTLLAMKESKTARRSTLQNSLIALKTFGGSQFKFFLNGFDGPGPVRLELSPEYPPEYTLRITLDQIAYDLDVIVRAWQQRWSQSASPAMVETLNKADILAYQALAPAIRKGLIGNATVVTYFQKSPNVRLIPYAPVAFVGMPITALTTREDLLAIPHEVGHYVHRYRKARTDQDVTNPFADQPDWCKAWLEEIVADVYGALIGGPVMALGFEDLVTDDPVSEFIEDDGEHPVAALRPSLYHAVFAQTGAAPNIQPALVQRWQEWINKRGAPTTFRVRSTKEEIALTQAKATLETIVATLLQSDLAELPVEKVWSRDLPKGTCLETLRTKFAEDVGLMSDAVAACVPDVEMMQDAHGTSCIYLKEFEGVKPVEHQIGDTNRHIDVIKAKAPLGGYLPPKEWLALLDGSDWTTEGPTGGSTHE